MKLPEPGVVLMCDIRRGRPAARRQELATALVAFAHGANQLAATTTGLVPDAIMSRGQNAECRRQQGRLTSLTG